MNHGSQKWTRPGGAQEGLSVSADYDTYLTHDRPQGKASDRVRAEAPRVAPPPKPDKAAMRSALDALCAIDDVIELRALHKGRKRTDAGYFDGDHREALVNEAVRLNAFGWRGGPAHLAAGAPQREVDSDRHTARFRSHANSKESPYQNDYVVGEYLSRLMHGFPGFDPFARQPCDRPEERTINIRTSFEPFATAHLVSTLAAVAEIPARTSEKPISTAFPE